MQERLGQPFQLRPNKVLKCIDLCLEGQEKRIHIACERNYFSLGTASGLPCSEWNLIAHGYTPVLDILLPTPGVECKNSQLIKKRAGEYWLHYDVLQLMSWALSRAEEVGSDQLDQHARFPARASHAFNHGYLDRPIVDEWLEILRQVMQRQWPCIALKCPTFRLQVSHDVDKISHFAFKPMPLLLLAIGGELAKRRNVNLALLAPFIAWQGRKSLHPKDPLNTFDWIMDNSERRGIKSAFYFIAGSSGLHDPTYKVEHRAVRTLLQEIDDRGHEIGLHPSYHCYKDHERVKREFGKLKEVCNQAGISRHQWGARMHYLRWETPVTVRALANTGIDYDASLGYADSAGFRCGTCFEYQAFDPVRDESLPIRIRPLIAMECSVMAENYMGLGTDIAALDTFIRLKRACQAVNGSFTTLWHNSSLVDAASRKLYQALLDA